MNRKIRGVSAFAAATLALSAATVASAAVKDYDKNPPFSMTLLKPTTVGAGGAKIKAFNPKN